MNRYKAFGVKSISNLRHVCSLPPAKPLMTILLVMVFTAYTISNVFLSRAQEHEPPSIIYDEVLRWANWSWGTQVNASSPDPVYAGSWAMAVTYNQAWAGLSFQHPGLSTSPYTHFEFAVRADGPMPVLHAGLFDQAGILIKRTPIGPYITPQEGGWQLVSIPLSALGASDTTITRTLLQEGQGVTPSTFYVDEMHFATNTPAPGETAIEPIYDDALFWANWSWSAQLDPSASAPVHSGANSLGITFTQPWGGVSLKSDGVNTAPYSHIELAIHSGQNSTPPKLQLLVNGEDGALIKKISLAPYLTPGSGGWQLGSVPLQDLNAVSTIISRVTLQEAGGVTPLTFYVDQFRLIQNTPLGDPPPRELPIGPGAIWKYHVGTSAPPPNWKDIAFDDTSWAAGPSGFGYGDGDDSTILAGMSGNFSSVFVRKTFVVSDFSTISRLILTMDFDDGFVAYLNGVEVARANMADVSPSHTALATHPHEASLGSESPQPVEQIDISAHLGLLRQGENVLAVQGHNAHLFSSDFSLIPGLKTNLGPPPPQTVPALPIVVGDTWRYMKGTQAPPANWKTLAFDASGWASGPSGFGYGDGDDATVLSDMKGKYVSVFLRKEFYIEDPALMTRVLLSIDFDDGFIAYLNGVEVARSGMFSGTVAHTTIAKGYHEASRGDSSPQAVEVYDITGTLRPGTNVLAIQGHNSGLDSPDFSLIPELTGHVVQPAKIRFHVRPGAHWRYAKGTSEPPANWKELGFDDSVWAIGPSGFGYADGDDATLLWDMPNSYASVYIRKEFSVPDPTSIKMMFLNIDFDDAFVAYINGVEVARSNIKGAPPPFTASSETSREASTGGPGNPSPVEHFDLSGFTGLLVPGPNVLAIQGHNNGAASFDFSLIPSLLGTGDMPLDPVLTRYPYLQAPAQDAVTVVWATKGAGTPSVSYTKAGGPTNTAVGSSKFYSRLGGYYQHEVRLSGLEPSGLYGYSIALNDNPIGLRGPLEFKAAPSPGQPLTVAVFGDTGTGTHAQLQIRDRLQADTFDLLLHTGDVSEINGYFHEYQKFVFDVYRDLFKKVPFAPTLGNGDWWTSIDHELGEAFKGMFRLPVNAPPGKFYYSFDYGDVHFVGIDAENITLEQWKWLDADLGGTSKPWKIAYFHRAPFDDGKDHPITEGGAAGVRSAFVPLFEKYGVDLVLNGHNAVYGRTVPLTNGRKDSPYADITTVEDGGIVYVTTGGGGDFSLDWLNPDAFHAAPGAALSIYHYTKLQINGCRLTIQAIDSSGTIRDSSEIDKCLVP